MTAYPTALSPDAEKTNPDHTPGDKFLSPAVGWDETTRHDRQNTGGLSGVGCGLEQNRQPAPILSPSPAAHLAARELGIDPRSVQDRAERAAIVDVFVERYLASLPGRYAPYQRAPYVRRHHLRAGQPARTASERYMDQRGPDRNPDLRSSRADVRREAWANRGPTKAVVYPTRVTQEDVRRREITEAVCVCGCGRKLNDRRRGAKWFSDACRMKAARSG